MNNITLLGRLTANVDLKESNNTKYAQFSIAVDRARNNGVDFINCVAFNKLAEALANNCSKGRQLLVNGRLQTSQNKGITYYTVVSGQITFLQRPRSDQGRVPNGNSNRQPNVDSVNAKVNQASKGGKTVAQGGKPF